MGLGASQPDKVQARVSKFVNPKVTKCVAYITVPFQIYQESDGSVGFAPDPNIKQGQKNNPFAKIYKSLDRSKDETVVITKISVEHIFNQVDVPISFLVKDVFDFKPGNSGHEAVVEDPTSSGGDGEVKQEMRVIYGGDRTIEENEVEEKGGEFTITVPPSFDDVVRKENRVLYRSTLVPTIVEKFAGQHEHLLDVVVNAGDEILLIPADHPLMLFILACKEVLKVQDGEVVMRRSERDEDTKVYQVAPRVVNDAKRYLKATVFAKMFYTTFKDTDVHVNVTRDNDELLRSKWFKVCGPKAAYKPIISWRLKVKYFKVDTKKPRSRLYAELTNYL